MNDPLARQTAKHAHARIHELNRTVARLQKDVSRRSAFRHRCHLCGDPVKKGSAYCHAHSWAEA